MQVLSPRFTSTAFKLLVMLILALGLSRTPGALASLFEPAPRNLAIPEYAPVKVPFHPGDSLVYRVSWAGIPAAGAVVDMRPDPKNPNLLTGEARVSTNKFIDLFYRMRDYVEEHFSRQSLKPRDMYIKQHENRHLNEYMVDFDRGAGVVKMVKRNRKRTETFEFHSSNPVGPISGALMALSQPLEVGQTLVFDVFAGQSRYVVGLTVDRRERISTVLGTFEAFRITPTVFFLTADDVRSKASELTLWVSADQRHLPLRAQAAVFVGHLTADLVRVDGDIPAAG